ncbi:hypothetical protein H2202_005603 [Exophiala xenobiotica]|nr:hypothetical protein H2202_005603 [Exophiala xenobiotica]KAK5262019.1 hypothetical protein LTR40_001091 [Exophiala xenobiotica]KAK5352274.1 hypothetical protein LTR61_004525 [Exophiala xenobiotica]KAK5381202.1 hypothetical protein LTS03_004042 [Exophiala xenobiotica]KAK5466105.1 hypothetical protein LTR20_004524 [Exophiala xenobiotica]
MKLQDLSQNTGGQKVIILFNLLLRFGQLVTGVVTIILYSQENGYWLNRGIPGKTSELSQSSRQLPSASSPPMLSYRPVAFAAPWDMIMFFLYSAAVKFSPSKAK